MQRETLTGWQVKETLEEEGKGLSRHLSRVAAVSSITESSVHWSGRALPAGVAEPIHALGNSCSLSVFLYNMHSFIQHVFPEHTLSARHWQDTVGDSDKNI